MRIAESPIQSILKHLHGNIYIVTGSPLQQRQPGISVNTNTRNRERGPLVGSSVAAQLPELLARVKASRCRNPRDEATDQGCLQDHSYEVPTDLKLDAFQPFLAEIAELLWLANPVGVPRVGFDGGQAFALSVAHNHVTGKYDVRLELLENSILVSGPHPIMGDSKLDLFQASDVLPEDALLSCLDSLGIAVQKQLVMTRLIEQFKAKYAGQLAHENHPYFSIRPDNTLAMNWRVGDEWFTSVGPDRIQALINGLDGKLTCHHDAGRGCTREPNHDGGHYPPQNSRHRAAVGEHRWPGR